MIVCHCKAITDREIRKAVLEGAQTCTDVARMCNAGGECGGCQPLIEQLIGKEAASRPQDPQQHAS
jgi:bacterioferritin-associated ferredoxin